MSGTKCPECGVSYLPDIPSDVKFHDAFHDEYVYGPATMLGDGTHFVTPGSPSDLRKAAGDAARAARRNSPYDFPPYDAEEQPSADNPIIVLEVREGHVIAMILTRETNCEHVAFLDDFEPNFFTRSLTPIKTERVAPHRRRAIIFIWVLQNQRGKGLLDRMLAELETHLGQSLHELAHCTPFTEAAVKFWRKRGANEFYVV